MTLRVWRVPTVFTSTTLQVAWVLSRDASSVTGQNRKALIDRIIRVNHAGEFGANRIYCGQMAVIGKSSVGPVIKEMWEQEKSHLRTFEKLIPKYETRPSWLLPVWHVAGFGLGAGSALLGKEAAMACTVAVEECIGQHYNNQIRDLLQYSSDEHVELLETISRCRDEELEHHNTGIQYDAKKVAFYEPMKKAIQLGCWTAIWLSERI